MPDELAEQMKRSSVDVARSVLEAVAIEGYRSGNLTAAQVRTLLGLGSRMETDAFLKRVGILREYTADELARDYENSRQASSANKAAGL